VIIDHVEDLGVLTVGELPVSDVGLPQRIRLLRGRFCGWETISPSRPRIRQIVPVEGTGSPACSR
jgi:hypothetical protein